VERAREELPAGPVTLRRWADGDADELHRVVHESLGHLGPWMGWAARGYSGADARDHLRRARDGWAEGTEYGYAIRLADGALVGACSMFARIGPGGMEIGYWLHPGHTGHGNASAAAAALTAEAFRIGADRVEIVHDAANVRSGAVPRRLGFTEVARRPPQEELSSGEAGEDVVWLRRAPETRADQ
jgi:RimJ/RimL family protein N-acetyltransferase